MYGQVAQVDASHRHASYIHYTAGQTGAAEIGDCTLSSGQEIQDGPTLLMGLALVTDPLSSYPLPAWILP